MKHGTPSQANRGPKNPGRSIIRFNGQIHNYFEVSWALFLAKGLRIPLNKTDLPTSLKPRAQYAL
jgi:hypothetical protein